jgi:proteasome lid subunit RPN8/RPN11
MLLIELLLVLAAAAVWLMIVSLLFAQPQTPAGRAQPAITCRGRALPHFKRPAAPPAPAPAAGALPLFSISQELFDDIGRTIGSLPAETGGMLGGDRAHGRVTHFAFDVSSKNSRATYSPDTRALTDLLRNRWKKAGVQLMGFVHSHPSSMSRPSRGDLEYAERILAANPHMECLLLPIVLPATRKGPFTIHPYRVSRGESRTLRIEAMTLEVLDAAGRPVPAAALVAGPTTDHSLLPVEALDWEEVSPAPLARRKPAPAVRRTFDDPAFERVVEAYDLGRMAASRLVVAGCGGAGQFVLSAARAGVGSFVLIDHDRVSVSNIATQHVFRDEVGRPKVECLKEQILRINPHAEVRAIRKPLEALDDARLRLLALQPIKCLSRPAPDTWGRRMLVPPAGLAIEPEAVVLCGFTDSFPAQARINRLGLHLGLPTLCAQVYGSGRGAEITFTYPGVTPACGRCALSSRYRAYLEEGFTNPVTSHGTPIFSTDRLNAIKGFIALAILHHGTSHPRWGGLLSRIGNRNLIQIRMDPDLELRAFQRVFSGGDQERILFDETVWLPQQPDGPLTGKPACPDCHGTGNLHDRVGTIADTRETTPARKKG